MGKQAKQLTDTVSEKIIRIILDKNMQPGDKLPNETELAKMLGVGRSTLREATRSLVSRNILEVRQGSGMYVSKKKGVPEDPLGLTLLYGVDGGAELALELIEIRLLLEPEIAATAASRITPEQEAELIRRHRIVVDIIQSEHTHQQHLDAEVQYHSYIAGCCGNGVLNNLIPIITSSISMAITTYDAMLRSLAVEQHIGITEAICRHDALGAKYAMIVHLNTSREYYIKMKQMERMAKREASERS